MTTEFADHHQFRRMYWREAGSTRTSCTEENATHVELETRRGPYRSSMTFRWPEESVRVHDLTSMLETAFGAGIREAKAEIRQALGL